MTKKSFSLKVQIEHSGNVSVLSALIDPRAAGNFIDIRPVGDRTITPAPNSWMHLCEPQISWKGNKMIKWYEWCFYHCLHLPQLHLSGSVSQSSRVFSKTKARSLLPHRPYYCTNDLHPHQTTNHGLLRPESTLAGVDTRPSASPTSSGFFFMKKQAGGLHPYIEYPGILFYWLPQHWNSSAQERCLQN